LRLSADATRRSARADLPPCLRTCALTTANECKHPPCPWRHQFPATTRSFCAINPAPFLARFGLKGPCNCFGLRKTPGLSHAPRQALKAFRARTGSDPATGGWSEPPRSHILADFADTRARRKPLKPLRAGMPGDSGVLVVTRVRSTTTKCTRGRGCNGHPAFPTPSKGRKIHQRLGRIARRGRRRAFGRHCERSEAIHKAAKERMDCFASLAMTTLQLKLW